MFKIYTVCIPKNEAYQISASPYNLVITLGGSTYLEEVTREEMGSFVYFLLNEIDYKELKNFQDNIISVGVDEVVKRNGRILVK